MDELLILNSELRHSEKSLALAYLMLLGGHLGVHRFYLKRFGTAVAQLALFLVATATYIVGIILIELAALAGVFILGITVVNGLALFIWIIVDLFLMPRMVREWNEAVENRLLQQIRQFREMQNQPVE